tara:strand:- start:263 stop:589 length:327 start_codon:yes stop_codon:yes gene_type:complete
MADNIYAPNRTMTGDFASQVRVFAHDTYDLFQGAPAALVTTQIPGTEQPARGACLYAGVAISEINVTMESGNTQTFKGIAAGSFLPILVTKVNSVSGPTGAGELIALL